MSELVYYRFNPLFPSKGKDYFLKNISTLANKNIKASLIKLIDLVAYDHKEELNNLKKELQRLKMKLKETFDKNGTQAILVESDAYIILAFRGTEATSIKDIKSDLKVTTINCDTKGKIHSGFNEAFEQVRLDIETALNEDALQKKPLFITGHSLGGALATIASKKIIHRGGNAGCYTFGSPRVGNAGWISGIKTPLYRVVNAADCVTMLPPGADIVDLITFVISYIPFINKFSNFMSKFSGYRHGGDMRYLTNCQKGKYTDVKLLYQVNFIYRIKQIVFKKLPWRKMLSDHSISVYRKKLFVVAQKRNT